MISTHRHFYRKFVRAVTALCRARTRNDARRIAYWERCATAYFRKSGGHGTIYAGHW